MGIRSDDCSQFQDRTSGKGKLEVPSPSCPAALAKVTASVQAELGGREWMSRVANDELGSWESVLLLNREVISDEVTEDRNIR